jgi:hypothetical protein
MKEVLDALNLGDKNPRLAGILEPSPGLEPGTASLPWRFWFGNRGHTRSLAITICLQFEGLVDVAHDR